MEHIESQQMLEYLKGISFEELDSCIKLINDNILFSKDELEILRSIVLRCMSGSTESYFKFSDIPTSVKAKMENLMQLFC